MDLINNTALCHMTIKEIQQLVSMYEPTGLEFWDIVLLYQIN